MPEHRLTERDLPLKGSRLYRRKDSGGAGAETPTVPFPYQKAKGGYAPNLGGTTKRRLSSQTAGMRAFFCAQNPKRICNFIQKEIEYG